MPGAVGAHPLEHLLEHVEMPVSHVRGRERPPRLGQPRAQPLVRRKPAHGVRERHRVSGRNAQRGARAVRQALRLSRGGHDYRAAHCAAVEQLRGHEAGEHRVGVERDEQRVRRAQDARCLLGVDLVAEDDGPRCRLPLLALQRRSLVAVAYQR